MESDGEITEILASYDLTGSVLVTAELTGCSHHTVAKHVATRDAGRPSSYALHGIVSLTRFCPRSRNGSRPPKAGYVRTEHTRRSSTELETRRWPIPPSQSGGQTYWPSPGSSTGRQRATLTGLQWPEKWPLTPSPAGAVPILFSSLGPVDFAGVSRLSIDRGRAVSRRQEARVATSCRLFIRTFCLFGQVVLYQSVHSFTALALQRAAA